MDAYTKMKYLFSLLLNLLLIGHVLAANDPLPSWQEGPRKQSIIDFVKHVTNKNHPDYVTPVNRIATIDNDGTLWLEQPVYTQVIFMIEQYIELAKTKPEIKQDIIYKKIVAKEIDSLTKNELLKIYALTNTGMTTQAYNDEVQTWLAHAKNPRFKQHYTDLVYQPMLEVLEYLHSNNFTVYIVSGGSQDFIRAFSNSTYHISVDRVLGTTSKTNYTWQNGRPVLIRTPAILFVCDSSGKPEAIDLLIGKKPIIAFGNSDGDREMLEWTQSNTLPHLMLLVHHDDAKREYAYDANSKVGTFSASLMQEAQKNQWQVISMKDDWKVIFPFEMKQDK